MSGLQPIPTPKNDTNLLPDLLEYPVQIGIPASSELVVQRLLQFFAPLLKVFLVRPAAAVLPVAFQWTTADHTAYRSCKIGNSLSNPAGASPPGGGGVWPWIPPASRLEGVIPHSLKCTKRS